MVEPIKAEPEDYNHMDVGWSGERTRKKIQMIFSSYLIGKSASDLLVLAGRVEQGKSQQAKGSKQGQTSGWTWPTYDGDYGSGGGSWGD